MIDLVYHYFGEVLQSQVTQMSVAFAIAARLHRRWVRQDMSEHFGNVTEAINNVAESLSRDLASHSKRMDEHEKKIDGIAIRVETLEKKID